jgi:hypothetical protein
MGLGPGHSLGGTRASVKPTQANKWVAATQAALRTEAGGRKATDERYRMICEAKLCESGARAGPRERYARVQYARG